VHFPLAWTVTTGVVPLELPLLFVFDLRPTVDSLASSVLAQRLAVGYGEATAGIAPTALDLTPDAPGSPPAPGSPGAPPSPGSITRCALKIAGVRNADGLDVRNGYGPKVTEFEVGLPALRALRGDDARAKVAFTRRYLENAAEDVALEMSPGDSVPIDFSSRSSAIGSGGRHARPGQRTCRRGHSRSAARGRRRQDRATPEQRRRARPLAGAEDPPSDRHARRRERRRHAHRHRTCRPSTRWLDAATRVEVFAVTGDGSVRAPSQPNGALLVAAWDDDKVTVFDITAPGEPTKLREFSQRTDLSPGRQPGGSDRRGRHGRVGHRNRPRGGERHRDRACTRAPCGDCLRGDEAPLASDDRVVRICTRGPPPTP